MLYMPYLMMLVVTKCIDACTSSMHPHTTCDSHNIRN
jgi:hypothetical protein